MRKSLQACVAAILLLSGQAAQAQTVGERMDELKQLRESVVVALQNAVSFGAQGDRASACSSANYARTQLTRMGEDVDFITAAVQGPDYDNDDRAQWAALAEKMNVFIRNEREVAMTDWQRTC